MNKLNKILGFMILSLCLISQYSWAESKDKTIELSVYERVSIRRLYLEKTDWVRAIAINSLKLKLEFSQDEIKNYEIIASANRTTWNIKKDKEKESIKKFNLSEMEIKVLNEGIDLLSKQKEVLTNQFFIDLCQKIKNLKLEEKAKKE